MNEFYHELLTPIIYKWVSTRENAHKSKQSCSVCFCNDKYHAKIDFHEHDLIELSIIDKETEESLFYLHFEMHDLKTTTQNIQSFFDFLKNPIQKEEIHLEDKQNGHLKILLSCTSGLTTSYYAYLMQEALDKNHNQIEVDAINYLELDSIQEQYDYILLAPQISYRYQELRQKYGEKVLMIDTIDFASGNVNKVLNQII